MGARPACRAQTAQLIHSAMRRSRIVFGSRVGKTGAMRAAPEALTAAFPAWRALHARQYAEMNTAGSLAPLDVNYEAYRQLDAAGVLSFVALRTGDGELVGYALHFVQPSLHFRSTLAAVQDGLYVVPEHRGGTAALKLLRAARRDLEARGVRRWLVSEVAGHPLGRLFAAFGFAPIETYHEMWLGQ